jgi:exonuclease III
LNIYAPNARSTTFIKEALLRLEAHIETHTIIVGDFNIPFSSMDRLWKQKINRAIINVTEVIKQMYFTDFYRIFHPKTK